MTGEGLLRHEGSSPPSAKPSSANAGLVLDIDSLAPPTCGKYVRLVLSKPNPRRLHSQTWSFTEVSLVLVWLMFLAIKCKFLSYFFLPLAITYSKRWFANAHTLQKVRVSFCPSLTSHLHVLLFLHPCAWVTFCFHFFGSKVELTLLVIQLLFSFVLFSLNKPLFDMARRNSVMSFSGWVRIFTEDVLRINLVGSFRH